MKPISTRLVIHFPGFEPLSATQHRDRYERAAAQAARAWGIDWVVSPLTTTGGVSEFSVDTSFDGAGTHSEIVVMDHNDIISTLQSEHLLRRLAKGFVAGAVVIREGGAHRFLRHAWRFGLFFLFPFLFILIGMLVAGGIALLPAMLAASAWWYGLSLPLGLLFFFKLFLPMSDRFHVLHLFADWRMAVAVAHDNAQISQWIDQRAAQVIAKLVTDKSDELLVTSHSMGASLAISVMARVLELRPDLFSSRKLVFVTLGGAALQCGLLSSAKTLRARVGHLARHPATHWTDIQCLTDPIHLYKCDTVELSGHADAPRPTILTIRFKHSLSEDRYRKNKRNLLRMHRQYVLGPDKRSDFDFTMLTAGPFAWSASHAQPADVPIAA
ncbi:hypothetical protein FE840_014630 [Peteryoungia desertarenae]|uniref:Alpha/beta hydrolase n=1 Tax=Peteryoungia desertarenae TaxID=1813451 RepID=A0ABX6QRY1_9HYPH|nr:hypothetical protein [Peteryoungia desertarenae]QLF71426.1 hypothetical protein FE840_014630 [Peteryoungia desertarenae]